MKYAIIADIHGNMPALKLVLEDARKQGADAFLFAGDYCVSAPWFNEVISCLRTMPDARIIRGNEERYLHLPDGEWRKTINPAKGDFPHETCIPDWQRSGWKNDRRPGADEADRASAFP